MMHDMRFLAAMVAYAAVAAIAATACDTDSSPEEPQNSADGSVRTDGGASSSGDPAGPSGTESDVFEDTSCDRAPCEGFTVNGIPYAACCIPRADACGVAVGNTCVERAAFDARSSGSGGLGDGGFSLGESEPVVSDPSCPALASVMGMEANLPGCCDSTGVCGYSTAGIGEAMGFEIPAMCVTAEDPLGQFFVSGDDPLPCNYPADAGSITPDGG